MIVGSSISYENLDKCFATTILDVMSHFRTKQGDTKIDLGSMKNYFGEHQENNSGSREKRVKFQREPGAGDPPYRVSLAYQYPE